MEIKYIATFLFAIALLHTFSVGYFKKLAHKYKEGTAQEALFHMLSEVEIVFGFWAFVFISIWFLIARNHDPIDYLQSLNMTEPMFIFCIMIVASSKPVINFARRLILLISKSLLRILPFNAKQVELFVLLSVGPLLGSLITEPAAITIVALLLYKMIDPKRIDQTFLYSLLAVLFVNISVGGALTNFAAPPILIVARTWNWSLSDVFFNLGEASLLTVIANTFLFVVIFKKKIIEQIMPLTTEKEPMPLWVTVLHLLFLAAIVINAHYSQVFFGIFLIFIGLTVVSHKYQETLKIKESLLVAFFLGGLVVFGSFQRWWLEPIISSLSETALFLSAICLTAITDNAALTYLGSQVPTITDSSKWALVSGAIVGGGLTILANAPNPAGFSILSSKFPNQSLNAGKLLLAAIPPTVVAAISFLIL